jgi:hypothetical protein
MAASKPVLGKVVEDLEKDSFAYIKDAMLICDVTLTGAELVQYQGLWDRLPEDPVYKFRGASMNRYWINTEEKSFVRLLPQPFALDYNNNAKLGAKPRAFEPPPHCPAVSKVDLAIMQNMIIPIISARGKHHEYLLGYHQFRITSTGSMEGLPTAEGVHQDGAEFVFIMYVNGTNLALGAGESHVYTLEQPNGVLDTPEKQNEALSNRVFSHAMTKPFECIVLSDREVRHDNNPVKQDDTSIPATRDVLVCWARLPKLGDDLTACMH